VLGQFIVWQLAFLLVANVLGPLQSLRARLAESPWVRRWAPAWSEEQGGVYRGAETALTVTRRWGQLTGQPQDWSLFAPNVSDELIFVAVEFRWEQPLGPPPILLLSDNEPRDPRYFWRWGRFRLRRYESAIGVTLSHPVDKTVDEVADGWRETIHDRVRQDWRAMRAYLDWRWQDYQRQHPSCPQPKEIVLWSRRYHIPPPVAQAALGWEGPDPRPVARWQPREDVEPGFLPVEMYHPVFAIWERLRVEE
jgi:hypothetical protein